MLILSAVIIIMFRSQFSGNEFSQDEEFLKSKGLTIADDGIVEVNSKQHLPLQFLDVILVQFVSN